MHPARPAPAADPGRLARLNELVKHLSLQDDPDRLVHLFNRQSDLILPHDGIVTVSSRDLEPPSYRITRSWRLPQTVNPWTEAHRLPVLDGGLLAELHYAARPVLLDRLEVPAGDPAREHLEGMGSLIGGPGYDHGKAVHSVFLLRRPLRAFTAGDLEGLLLHANLLGMAAANLLLAHRLEEANRLLDAEMRQVGRMQRHLLPAELPRIEGLELAASYATSSRAGGDYYDVLSLPEDRWGLFIGDVSGHGIPAAVVMTMMHTLLHAFPGPAEPPGRVLAQLNDHLAWAVPDGTFATAFYGVYEPHRRRLRYAMAGHPPPRVRRRTGPVQGLELGAGLPLGIVAGQDYPERETTLKPGDALLLYTDGIVEGMNPAGEMFGTERLDSAMTLGPLRAGRLVRHLEVRFQDFLAGRPEHDDRTLLAAVAVP